MSNDKDFKVKNGIQPTAYQEGLGTVVSGSVAVGYDLSVAAYDSKSFSVSPQEGTPRASAFKSDGTKLYVVGSSSNTVHQYSLSTAYDISTASYDSVSVSVGTQTSNDTRGLAFKTDGTKMYVASEATKYVYQYSLSTAWDVSTASYDSVSFYVNSQDIYPQDVLFKTDGTKMYMVGYSTDAVYQYDLTTAWDISTASYANKSLSTSAQDPTGAPMSADFSSDGTSVFVLGLNTDTVFQYNLSTAWDISTAAYSSTSFSVTSQDATPLGVQFGNDGQKMYIAGNTSNTIYQYSTGSTLTTNTLDLSTGNAFQITPTSNIQVGLSNPAASGTVSQGTLLLDGAANGYDLSGAAYDSVSFSVNSQNTNPLDIAFNTDGTKMYIMGNINDTVLQYSLSTGFDLSTASYDNVSFATTSQDTNPRKLSFNNDGTKMYMFGTTTDTVYQYSLSTAFDLSTTSYDSVSFNASSQSTNPYGLAFNSDGTKMYLGGGSVFYQYSLSTAFDLSTTSYDSVSFSVSGQDSSAPDLTFNNDGTKMYVVGQINDNVYQYSLSTAFDLSTASYDSVSFSVGSQDGAPNSLAFSNDGTKMFVVGNVNDTVYQYSTGSAYTITWDSTIQFGGGTAPDSPLANETDVLTFSTRDGGTTYQAAQAIDGAV